MNKVQNIADSDFVLRFLKVRDQYRVFETGELRGVHATAFEPRPCDKGALSVTWIEFFQGSPATRLKMAISTFLSSWGSSVDQPIFARANVGAIKQACRSAGQPVRVVHEPSKKNPAHAAIRRLQEAEAVVFDQLAHEAFADIIDENGAAACKSPMMGRT